MSESKAKVAREAQAPLPPQPVYDPRSDASRTTIEGEAAPVTSPEDIERGLRAQIDSLHEQLNQTRHQVVVMEKYAGHLTDQRNEALDAAAKLVANIPG